MSAVLVKLDENLGRTHASLLQEAGHDVARVYDEGLSGQPDDVLWDRVCTEGRLLITLDVDFSDVRRFQPGTYPGILLLRPHSRARQAVADVLSRVLRERPLESLRGCLAIADESRTRIRGPLSPSEQPPG